MTKSQSATPTIRDIAKLAKVHYSTVSLALNNNPRIPLATRNHIQEIAASLGYSKNSALSALSNCRHETESQQAPQLLVVSNRETYHEFKRLKHNQLILSGISHQAKLLGYDSDLVIVGNQADSIDTLKAKAFSKEVSGIILASLHPPFPSLFSGHSNIRLVKIDSAFIKGPGMQISCDNQQGVRLALRRLAKIGYSKIGLATGRYDDLSTYGHHYGGYKIGMSENGLPEYPIHMMEESDTDEVATDKLERWIREHKFDAVISNWNSIPVYLHKSGFAQEHEFAFCSLSLRSKEIPYAGIVQNHHRLGEQAVNVIAGSMITEQSQESMFIEGFWKDGDLYPHLGDIDWHNFE
ncbi:LacI family DNA-binding transcriptional regulator [Pelagicoccus mobilis]|uniref:LacI family DNA-binding transcriptional regulator n=1 Tax=Pelagicoccus mobilis TaxID=415221 RepID=A0A934VT56_9BACT|nr:LacI family DNA-binding transcriptional regulator [Pelagicoccus mobilis]MBK1879725.1 LacI family DNA-binding transcriptional regulator [Pelagicoccus mobilis]